MLNTKKEINRFSELCCKTQEELKAYLHRFLVSNGYKVVNKDGFLYAKGTLPYLVTAHMDTVHTVQCTKVTVHKWKGKHRIQSSVGIGGDDRCGIYMIVRMILNGYRPSVLFCEDEEIGSVGASKFVLTDYVEDLTKLNYLIELDRANANDAVFYECDNEEFTDFILENTGYKEATGTWTDIVELSDACKIASVNFSCGYYKAHTTSEYVIYEEMINTLAVVEKLLRTESKQYEFIRKITYANSKWYLTDSYWDEYYDSLYDMYTPRNKGNIYGMEICWNNPSTRKEDMTFISGTSEEECMYNFFCSYRDVCFNDIIDYYFDFDSK